MLRQLLQHLRRTTAPEPARSIPATATAPAPPRADGAEPVGGGSQGPAPAEPVLLDVRTEREFAAVSLQGSLHLPLSQIEERIGTLVPDRRTPLQVVCASGSRSGAACMLLRQLGYTDVTNAGGLYAAAATLGRPVR